jgi:hypothetical protein
MTESLPYRATTARNSLPTGGEPEPTVQIFMDEDQSAVMPRQRRGTHY